MQCENCQQEYLTKYGSGRFCSVKCARGFATKAKRKEINQKVSKALKKSSDEKELSHVQCPYCSSNVPTEKGLVQHIRRKHQERLSEYLSLRKFENFSRGDRRNILLIENNYSCQLCGYNKVHPIWNKPPLEVHHIDGNTKNNKKSNLMLVCLNCHFMVDEKYRFRGRSKKI